jgi:hypothetical protein
MIQDSRFGEPLSRAGTKPAVEVLRRIEFFDV